MKPLLAEERRETFVVEDNQEASILFGQNDCNLRTIEDNFPVRIVSRGNKVVVTGNTADVNLVVGLLQSLLDGLRSGSGLDEHDVDYSVRMARSGSGDSLDDVLQDVVLVTSRGKSIRPKTAGQKEYLEALRNFSMVFSIGPAGTGKTYLAMAVAVAAFRAKRVHRLVLTRPAVEAGEKLGFLPGDLQEKVDPYLRPLYDALYDILGADTFEKYMGRGMIEVAPLAYMRGRTLDDSFIILDEAQNTTEEQMKMFLTRMGFNSQVVVTGDLTQIDLPRDRHSGLKHARRILEGVEGIEFVYLTHRDVVRHPLVTKIIQAYDRSDQGREPVEDSDNGGSG